MRQADIVIGGVYETKIGDSLVKVKVLYAENRNAFGDACRTRYRVERCDNDKVLPKARTAAALRPVRTAEEHNAFGTAVHRALEESFSK